MREWQLKWRDDNPEGDITLKACFPGKCWEFPSAPGEHSVWVEDYLPGQFVTGTFRRGEEVSALSNSLPLMERATIEAPEPAGAVLMVVGILFLIFIYEFLPRGRRGANHRSGGE